MRGDLILAARQKQQYHCSIDSEATTRQLDRFEELLSQLLLAAVRGQMYLVRARVHARQIDLGGVWPELDLDLVLEPIAGQRVEGGRPLEQFKPLLAR